MIKTTYNTFSERVLLEDTSLKLIRDYLVSQKYPEALISEILNKDFIRVNPSYYLYYPYLFCKSFGIAEDSEEVKKLSISGFLYYRSIIIVDDIFDNMSNRHNFNNFLIANTCQEESIKILSSLFSLDSSFWNIWNFRKSEYAKAYKLDKTMQTIESYDDFEALADYKSAFGKIAIDALFYLSGKKAPEKYKALLESHKFFYAGFQIMDDIKDYREDVENNQFNISKYELDKLLKSEDDALENYSVEDQSKLAYLKGVAPKLYRKAIHYLDLSSTLVTSFKDDTSLWRSETQDLYNTSVTHFLNIEGYIKSDAEVRALSNDKQSATTTTQALHNALDFIASKQDERGNWTDIFNDAGVSDVWTTGFTAYTLTALNGMYDAGKLDQARKFIQEAKLEENLWGYNKMWIADADSSSLALLTLNDKNTALNDWISFQNPDGGFSTYNNENSLIASLNTSKMKDVHGWMQSHLCVSAVAYLTFVELGVQDNHYNALRTYLLNHLGDKKNHYSYWWTETLYSVHYILKAALKVGDQELIKISEDILAEIIDKDYTYFYKGQLLSVLSSTTRLFEKYKTKATALANDLIENQFSDGSWKESHSLRIPHPSIINPEELSITWQQNNKGTNIVVKDYNRIFTTVNCLEGLYLYEQRERR